MTDLAQVAADISRALSNLEIPHMLVGGLAVAAWDEPRATLDVDVCVAVDPTAAAAEELIHELGNEFRILQPNPVAFVRRTAVLPLMSPSGIRIDCMFARLEFERQAINRAPTRRMAGRTVPVVSVEDLILVKAASERPKDIDDAQKLVRRHAGRLDRSRLEPLLLEFAEALARDDLRELARKAFP